MKRVSLIVLASLIGLLLFTPLATQTRAGTLIFDEFDVIIDINADGTVGVTEIMVARMQGDLNGGERRIPHGRFDHISDVQLTVDETPYAVTFIDQMTDMPIRSCRVVRNWEDYHIRWRTRAPSDPHYENETLRFVLRYTVHGALHWYPNRTRFQWNAIPPNREATLSFPGVRVNLPPELKQAGYDTENDVSGRLSSDATRRVGVSEDAIHFEARNLDPGQHFTILIDLPPGVVDDDIALNAYLRGGLGVILLIIAAPLCGLITWIRWRLKGRDPDPILDQAYYEEPPDDTPPGVVAALLREQADVEGVTATLLHLADRGVIRIEALNEDANEHRFILERDATHELTRWEETLVNGLFGKDASPGDAVASDDLENSFHTTCAKVEEQIWDETLSRDFFEGRPRRIVLKNVGIGAAIAAVGLSLIAISNPISGFLGVWATLFGGIPGAIFVSGWMSKKKSLGQKVGLIILLPFMVGGAVGFGFGVSQLMTFGWAPLIHFPGLILLMLGLLTIVTAPTMPRKTQKGADVAAAWKRFREFLERDEPFALADEDGGETFGAYLPVAVALGVERRWGRRFEEMAVLTSPYWYSHPHHHHHHDHMHGPVGSPGGFSAGDLTGSISSMASSIGATFASTPGSSGSGGGFSSSGGGGGGGGGGSAGGW
ncbi:MAG: DUF2207 domain-containing protein [Phycisphaerales bacterium]